jgi:two-component system, chemotaxis family, sensor kinase CheA
MDDFTREEMEQLMAVFRDQSLELLDGMSQDLLLLEADGRDAEAMSRLRRAIHTIKGDSACIGLGGISELSHKLEDLLDAILNGNVGFEAEVVNLLLGCLDETRLAVSGSAVEDIAAEPLAELMASIAGMEELFENRNKPGESETRKPVGNRIGVEAAEKAKPRKEASHKESNQQAENQKEASQKAGSQKVGSQKEASQRRGPDYVRVEAARIDALLNLAGEMVIARSGMSQIATELERAFPKSELTLRMGGAGVQMGKLISELQKSVLKMRMVTIDHVFRRFARPMRELAAERDKLVEFEVSGGETELDRTLVDLIYEPLLHLLRNAVDHGLESQTQREAAGKPAAGKIRMRAYHEGYQVIVDVSDDGRGIDINSVKKMAVESGGITGAEAERMSDEEAVELVFLAGLSTAKEITRVSGRGIGASAVKSVVEELRGSIGVKTEAGAGTTFTLRMPLTLAIIKALLFKAGGQLLALPLLTVKEVARIKAADIVCLDGFESFRLRERFISIVRPRAALGTERRRGGSGAALREEAAQILVIVAEAAGRKFGVVADELIGEQELVIKPLSSEWLQNEALAGASILGDGRVALIVDAAELLRKAIKHERGKGLDKYAAGQ